MIGNYFWGGAAAPYEIEQSLRFNSADSTYLSRTTSGFGITTTCTISWWHKKAAGSTSNTNWMVGSYPNMWSWELTDGSSNGFRWTNKGGTVYGPSGSKYRDYSGWYHWIVTQSGTVSKVYLNGELLRQDNSNSGSDATNWYIGSEGGTDNFLNGYLAEFHFLDGTAVTDATSFGEFDDNGVWRPIEYTGGNYGTDGFYLKFDPSATNGIGHDHSGNGNNFTASGFTTSGTGTDVMSDTPTTNYCTWNPLSNNGVTISNGNLDTSGGSSGNCKGTLGMTSGKWYWEYSNMVTGTGTPFVMGLAQVDGLTPNGHDNWRRAVYFYTDGSGNGNVRRFENGSNVSADQVTVPSSIRQFVASDVLQIAFDADTGKVWTGKNNSWLDSSGGFTGNPGNGSNPTHTFPDTTIPMTPLRDHAGVAISASANFGQRAFAYTPPTGFKALNTSNLPAPDIADGSQNMQTVLWTGTGTARTQTGYNFQPDLLWIMNRSNSGMNARLHDVVRGDNGTVMYRLAPNQNVNEDTDTDVTGLTSTGFTIGNDGTDHPNVSGHSYVGWGWKAGQSSGSSNSDTGTNVTSTVSVNQAAGFSIVAYQSSTNTKPLKVGHGLGVKPSFILTKNRDVSASWGGYHSGLGATKSIFINSYGTAVTSTDYWNNTEPTDVYFSVYDSNNTHSYGTTNDFIAYCFAEVEGFSKFGIYERNGSSDGPFVYLGFTPALILIKEYAAGTESWALYDNKRIGYNPNDYPLFPNTSQTESYISSTYANEIDFLSNGFKIRTSDSRYNSSLSSYRYLYAAWAVNPFGGDGVSPATAQ